MYASEITVSEIIILFFFCVPFFVHFFFSMVSEIAWQIVSFYMTETCNFNWKKAYMCFFCMLLCIIDYNTAFQWQLFEENLKPLPFDSVSRLDTY